MHSHNDAERTTFYRQQAFAFATAALTTTIAEIKNAYLDLEQGWLCLAPRAALDDQLDPAPGCDSGLKTVKAPDDAVRA